MGIDYGLGTTNIDKATGIRYGVISQNECIQSWADSSEAEYGKPCCPKCGNEAAEGESHSEASDPPGQWVRVWTEHPESAEDYEGSGDYRCDDCRYLFDGDEAFGDEPLGYTLDDGEYKATAGSGGDIFILKSPYYTLCDFCSPCAPGAGYLTSEGSVKAYCFGHDWFHDHYEHPGIAPYRVFSVEDDREIIVERKDVTCDRCKGTGVVQTAELAVIHGVTQEECEANLRHHKPDLEITDHAIECWVCSGKKTVSRVVEVAHV